MTGDCSQSEAANDLAAMLHDEPWYHRTTSLWAKVNGAINLALIVWGEGRRPDSLPKTYIGFQVIWNRVSKKHPCPFGSVKPKEKS